ncbi:MAG: hypothetical protein M0P49_05030, partial [Bacilli bacterium]|nr:hypothetical protein [Bacilli bacterium]
KFFNKFFVQNNNYIICYEPNVLIEMKRRDDLFKTFKNLFKNVPSLLLKTSYQIINDQINSNDKSIYITVLNNIINNNFDTILNFFDSDEKMQLTIQNNEKETVDTVKEWVNKRNEFNKNISNLNLSFKSKNLLLNQLYEKQKKNDYCEMLKNYNNHDSQNIPDSIKIQSFCRFEKIFKSNKEINKNDVYDVLISGILPYVDAIITETNQADLYKQLKKQVEGIRNLEIYKVGDFSK